MDKQGVMIYRLTDAHGTLAHVTWVGDEIHLATALQARLGHGMTFEVLDYIPDLDALYPADCDPENPYPSRTEALFTRVKQWEEQLRWVS